MRDENPDSKPYTVKGPVIDLLDPQLPVLSKKVVNAGEQSLLYDLSPVVNKKQPKVLASASSIYDVKIMQNNFSFTAKSPQIH